MGAQHIMRLQSNKNLDCACVRCLVCYVVVGLCAPVHITKSYNMLYSCGVCSCTSFPSL